MEPKHLWTLKWTQPYNTYHSNDLVQQLRDLYEELIEMSLEDGEFDEANEAIQRIMKL